MLSDIKIIIDIKYFSIKELLITMVILINIF